MTYVPVPNVAMLELRQLLDGIQIENTSYWLFPDGWTVGSLGNLANLGVDWWTDVLGPLLSSQISLREGFTTDLTASDAGVGSYSVGLPVAGGQAQEAMSNNVAMVVSIRTAQRGRSRRGRNYVAGIPVSVVDQNTIQGAFATSVLNAYSALLGSGIEAGFTQVVVSRYSGFITVDGKRKPAPRTVGLYTEVTGFSQTDPKVKTMRMRMT
jgi:hypothetical protein